MLFCTNYVNFETFDMRLRNIIDKARNGYSCGTCLPNEFRAVGMYALQLPHLFISSRAPTPYGSNGISAED